MPRMVRLRRKQSGCSDLGELASRCRAAALRLRLTLCAMARIRLARLWFFSGGKFRGQAITSDQRRGWKSEETERFAPAITQDTRGNADNVMLHIPPGMSNTYNYDIPRNMPQGMYWYHSHLHGLTSAQVYSGL